MQDEEKTIRVKTLADFDRELGRDGDEMLGHGTPRSDEPRVVARGLGGGVRLGSLRNGFSARSASLGVWYGEQGGKDEP